MGLLLGPPWYAQGLITVHFIRHGQAGTRDDYDRLSDIGREQARRLGIWFARRRVRFDQAWSGRLMRQCETAAVVRNACIEAGGQLPDIVARPAWDEFDLEGVYRAIGPRLARDDAEFARQFEELRQQALDTTSRVHRTWSPCDTTVVRTWIAGRYPFEGESFDTFVARVKNGADLLREQPNGNIAVFTSATPAAIWAGMALDLDARRIMQLAGASYNTAMTVIRIDGERVRLMQFNSVPHLDCDELMTHR